MKKLLALLPALALMFIAASCSDSEEPRQIPNDPVISVPAVADDVTIDVPAQVGDYVYTPEISSNSYRFTFDNGQNLICYIDTNTLGYAVAKVIKIEEGADNVIIPPYLDARIGEDDVQIPVICLELFENAVAETVKSITLPKTVNRMVATSADGSSKTFTTADAAYWRVQVGKCPNVEKFELENGFPGYASIDGSIYTADLKSLVAVPKGKTGIFTVADDVENVQDQAFYNCKKIDGITFPVSLKSLGSEALVGLENLLVINMQPTEAPEAGADTFGFYVENCLFRIPAGCMANYTFLKPDIEEPVEPVEPDMEASDEVWDQYDADMADYRIALREYNEVMAEYNTHVGYTTLTSIQEVNF